MKKRASTCAVRCNYRPSHKRKAGNTTRCVRHDKDRNAQTEGNDPRLGLVHPMERRQYQLGSPEVHEGRLSRAGSRVCRTGTNIPGACIRMVGAIYSAKEESHYCESKIQVLDSHPQVWDQDPKDNRERQGSLMPKTATRSGGTQY
jgi:hypothetical protein